MNYKLSKFAWVKDTPDERDYSYKERLFETERPKLLPTAVNMIKGCAPVKNQGYIGSCTAQAIAAAIQFDKDKRGFKWPVAFYPSAMFIYYNSRKIEGNAKRDAGSQIRSGMKVVAKYGVCNYAIWKYRKNLLFKKPNKNCYTKAKQHQILEYLSLDNSSVTELKSCLAAGFPFIFGIEVFENFMSDSVTKNGIVSMPSPSERSIGGHAMLAVGYSNQRFIVRNSWGKDWGDQGYCYIPFDYLADTNIADDFWTIRLSE